MIRATPDTNVWVGGIRWRGSAYRVIQHGESGAYTIVTSHTLLYELIRVLRQVFAFSDDLAYEWYTRIHSFAEVIKPNIFLNAITRDPDDNRVIECAVAGRCEYVVSRDRDLLDLEQYDEIEIVDVEQFLKTLIESTTSNQMRES
ncbi:MAG: putative toxin-antitoxin system toxin component, PIN family [Anaerolineae bacterium]|nr:putative toxin-antitoxin system toxin component, PIN family [Anaerolineae bacterium]MCK4449047.1 putative toxin-antitoxin system toxin component, PIN family [Anaerolineae bacterium]